MKAQDNFLKLKRTSILMNFVKKQGGAWNHNEWQGLCDTLAQKGYDPIDYDQVGLLLEEKKAKYLERV